MRKRLALFVMKLGHKLRLLGEDVFYFGNRMYWYADKLEKGKK